jgi:hypothetical protein
MTGERHIIDLKKRELPPEEEQYVPEHQPVQKLHIGVKMAAVVLLALIAGLIYLVFSHHSSSQVPPATLLTPPAQTASKIDADSGAIAAKVGALMILPQGETPTIAKVQDLTPLKGQAFFQNAKVGDYVLIYTKAGRAILYRPSENKIIEVGPVTQ